MIALPDPLFFTADFSVALNGKLRTLIDSLLRRALLVGSETHPTEDHGSLGKPDCKNLKFLRLLSHNE
jgi:hypothetical protein